MHTETRRTIAYTLPWDDAPVDLSFVFEGDKPAGRHGFIGVDGARLVFDDKTEGRFWGTNFNGAACFPSHSYSEKVARRLAKFGMNLVRFHQMDADFSTPNLFQFTRGRRIPDSQRLDPTSMDRLDYLIHCLKREGVYIYMDMLTYRKFRDGDGVAEASALGPSAKPYSTFDRRLIELQKMFNEQLWSHVNPYTKLAYKDEPAIILSEITNECDVFTSLTQGVSAEEWLEPYRGDLRRRFKDWGKEKGFTLEENPTMSLKDNPIFLDFLIDITKAYYTEIIGHLRDLGVRIPITGTNWSFPGAPVLEAQMVTNFTDSHAYWYRFGTWTTQEKKFVNSSMLGEREAWLRSLSFFRVLDRPFFVSEWDHPWPNEYRAEGAIQIAAATAYQGWSGAAIHTYRYDCREGIDQLGAPITADCIGGVPYRGGVFDTFNDPAKSGLFYHAALMVRRGDVREPDTAIELRLPTLKNDEGLVRRDNTKALEGATEYRKIGIRLPGAASHAAAEVDITACLLPDDATEIRSDTGELYRNLTKRYAIVDSPRTRIAYGFLADAGAIALKGLTIRAKTDFAVIAISSLTDDDIAHSDNLLLTAVGRADNTDAKYNVNHTIQFDVGHGPVEIEVIEAEIELTTEYADLKMLAINPAGAPIGETPVTWNNGKASFKIGGEFPSMYYLIQRA